MRFLRILRETKGQIPGELIQEIYERYSPELQKIKVKYDRYRAENLPIHKRDYGELEPIVDPKLNNDIFGEIIELKVGHFAGKAASYGYDKGRAEYKKAYEVLSRFQVVNNLAHIDAQTTKDAAIAGKAYRLLYINPENELRVTMLKPYEVVLFYEHDPVESEFAIRFYAVEDESGEEIIHANVYSSTHMYEYVQTDNGFAFVQERLHQFIHCPVIMYRNNDEEMGDADKVLSLIDAYDYTTSDLNAEITTFRLAYLLILGGELTEEQVKLMRKLGALGLPEGTDAKFLTKEISVAAIKEHLDRLIEDIYHFSKTPNLRDSNFSGNSSGISMRYKMSGIEAKCEVFERIKINADARQFKVASTFWDRTAQMLFDAYSVIVEHTRNVPIDLKEIADSLKAYVDMGFPLAAILPQVPFVDDPEYVLQLIEEERLKFEANAEKISETRAVKTKEQEIPKEERLLEE